MTAWLTRLRDRPITERERRTATAVVSVLLAAAAILLAAGRPAGKPHHHVAPRRSAPPAAVASRAPAPAGGALPIAPTASRTAREFLAGYLAYLYGHAPAVSIKDATPALVLSLRAHPPLVSPSMRALDPRVRSLHTAPASAGLIGLSALVNDGELASYHVGLLLASRHGRLLVSALEGT